MKQTLFEFAIAYQARIAGDRTDVRVAACQLALLSHLMNAESGTIDNATADLSKSFSDNGKWRGWVCLGLHLDGVIEPAGAAKSKRPFRNRGLNNRWRLADRDKAARKIESLQAWLKEIDPTTVAIDAGSTESKITTPEQEGTRDATN